MSPCAGLKKMPSPAYCSLEPAWGFTDITTLKGRGGSHAVSTLEFRCEGSSGVAGLHLTHNHKPSCVLATGVPDRLKNRKRNIMAEQKFGPLSKMHAHVSHPARLLDTHSQHKGLTICLKHTSGYFILPLRSSRPCTSSDPAVQLSLAAQDVG